MLPNTKLGGIVLAISILLVGTVAVGGGLAQPTGDDARTSADEVRIVDEEIVIDDGTLTISDTTIRGPGLGEHHIEDRTYAVDSTLRFDGFHVTYDGTEYTFCRITVHLEDIGVHLQDVHITEG